MDAARKNQASKLERLRQKKADLENRIALLKQRAAEAATRDDARCKLLIGAAVTAACDSGSIQADVVIKILDRFLLRQVDRAAFVDGRFKLPSGDAA